MRVAIIEDNAEDRELLTAYLRRFANEQKLREEILITSYENPILFLDQSGNGVDLILLDIQMPMMDGMTAAEKIRERGDRTPLIFVTNLAKYAVRGYNVNAVGFVLKPINYPDFFICMSRAVNEYRMRKGKTIAISGKNWTRMISTVDIYYVEVKRHMLYYHTNTGMVQASGSLTRLKESVDADLISCHNSFLINPVYIEEIRNTEVQMANGDVIPISRPR